jgi:hypothetical protein
MALNSLKEGILVWVRGVVLMIAGDVIMNQQSVADYC